MTAMLTPMQEAVLASHTSLMFVLWFAWYTLITFDSSFGLWAVGLHLFAMYDTFCDDVVDTPPRDNENVPMNRRAPLDNDKGLRDKARGNLSVVPCYIVSGFLLSAFLIYYPKTFVCLLFTIQLHCILAWVIQKTRFGVIYYEFWN
jgi:hypothetical protein